MWGCVSWQDALVGACLSEGHQCLQGFVASCRGHCAGHEAIPLLCLWSLVLAAPAALHKAQSESHMSGCLLSQLPFQ